MGSGGGGGGGDPSKLAMGGTPMPGIPIAGQGADVNPFEYGAFQNFLPDMPTADAFGKGERAPSAMGLNQDMFKYKNPMGELAPGSSGGGNDNLRNEFARMMQTMGGGNGSFGGGGNMAGSGSVTDGPTMSSMMGMGGGGGGFQGGPIGGMGQNPGPGGAGGGARPDGPMNQFIGGHYGLAPGWGGGSIGAQPYGAMQVSNYPTDWASKGSLIPQPEMKP
jgi:hypothetical protein